MNILCKLLWHIPIEIDYENRTAKCKRCGKKLQVCYDMCYGETVVEGIIEDNTGGKND